MSKPVLIAVVVALSLGVVSVTQYQRLQQMKQYLNQLQTQNQQLSEANSHLTTQYQLINEVLTHAAQQKEQAERNSADLRRQLKRLQQGSDCAVTAVPADLIRLQREAIAETNRLFTTP
ncbi:MAG: hypothetical protein ACRC5A_02635 [Enterobacteriaceae bacterium]